MSSLIFTVWLTIKGGITSVLDDNGSAADEQVAGAGSGAGRVNGNRHPNGTGGRFARSRLLTTSNATPAHIRLATTESRRDYDGVEYCVVPSRG